MTHEVNEQVIPDNVEDFERLWTWMRRNGQFEAATRLRRAWNRYVMSKYTERRLPPLCSRATYVEVTRYEDGRATGIRSVMR